jgi:hypothetical protein
VSLVSGAKGISLWQRAKRGASLRLLTIAGICWAGVAF